MKKVFLLLSIIIFCVGCSDDYDIPSNPKDAILGKWQLIEEGDENGMKKAPLDRKMEYFVDGTLIMYDVIFGEDSIADLLCDYTIDPDYLYHYLPGYNPEIPDIEKYIYTYYFYKNKLRIEYNYGLIPQRMGYPTIYIYKRVD